jgi:thioredoxin-related protein
MPRLPQRKAALTRCDDKTICVHAGSRMAIVGNATYANVCRITYRLFASALILACALCAPSRAQTPQHLPEPVDLRQSAERAAAEGRVLLVLFSESGCQWCERVRREYLLPMQRNAEVQKKALFFQVDVDSSTSLRDFAGRSTTQSAIARQYGIRIMPTVLMLGPKGETLAEPLIGFSSSDFYGAYLDERIEKASLALQARRRAPNRIAK